MRENRVLEVRGLTASVKKNGKDAALLKSVDLSIGSGRVLGLVGESGSGKSLTCGAILRILDDREMKLEGSIVLNGRELTTLGSREMRYVRGAQIGCVIQNPMNAFTPVHTVGSQLVETLRAHKKMSKKEAERQVRSALVAVNLHDPERLMRSYPHQWSGGMLQRAVIAVALCLKPALLIADEPTTALDAVNQLQVLRELEKLKRECGTSILLVSHDLGVIAQMADEVAVMKQGEIVEYADVHELFDRPRHPYTRMLLEARPGKRKEA